MLAAPLLLSALLAAPPADAPVVLSGTEIAASVRVGDRPLLVWHSAIDPKKRFDYVPLPKPFVFPLYTPGGVNVLDYASDDHPHHKGVWVSVDEVELHTPGIRKREIATGDVSIEGPKTLGPFKHWVEQGRIDTRGVALSDDADFITATNVWLTPEGEPVLQEETTITVRNDVSPKGTLLAYDITLTPPSGGGTVTIGDTKEGFVGVRMAPELDVKRGDGVITNSEGGVGEKECWGKVAAWCDCSAPATDAHPGGGVTLFDHPENFRKARYHARGYGLMAISPFGPKAYTNGEEDAAPVEITADKPLRLRYAVYVHDGNADAGEVAQAYQAYVDSSAK